MLHQNTGRQGRTAKWKRLVGQMQSLLKTIPLLRLQRVGHEDIWFLYEPRPAAEQITLLGGEDCLGRWAQFISDHDADMLAIGTEAGLLGGTEYGHLSTGWRGLLP